MQQHMNTQLHSDAFPESRGKDLVAGQGSRRWDFMVKEEIGPLVKDRGLAEVQKQREYQRHTLEKQKNNKVQLLREKTSCIFSQ